MISERDISEKFSVIWKENLPLLTPNFMRIFNESHVDIVNLNPVNTIEEVRYDLVSEAAFNLSEIVYNNNTTAASYLSNTNNIHNLITKTAASIWTNKYLSDDDYQFTVYELEEILKISENITEFVFLTKKEIVRFKPKLKGYGFISDLEADLLIDDTLFEVKTVNRNFKSTDLKQLFIYLALRQVGEGENWKYAGLYNPRKGTLCKFNIKGLIFSLTGGKTPNETFENLLNSLVRDIEIDSKF